MADNIPTDTEINVNDLPQASAPSSARKQMNVKKVFALGIIGILVLVIIGIFVSLGSRNSKATAFVNDGKRSVIKGDYKNAQSNYKNALAIKKNDPEAQAGLIDAISLNGNGTGTEKKALNESLPYIDDALKTNGNDASVLVAAGYAYETAGDYQKALTYYNQAVKIAPNSSDAWFHLGHDLDFLGEGKQAVADYEKSYSLDPKNPEALVAKANISLSKGSVSDSLDFFKKASQADNVNPQITAEALTGASLVRSLQNDPNRFNDATQLSKEAVDADPNFSPALAAYGYNLYLTSADKTVGMNYVVKAIQANPRISQNYVLLAQMYFAQKNYTQAINSYKEAISRVDNDNTILSVAAQKIAKGEYMYNLAKAYASSGITVDVSSLLIQAMGLNPTIKPRVKADVALGGFKEELNNNPEFAKLINS